MKHLPKLIFSVVGCQLVGLAGTPFTISALPTWYVGLNTLFFSPPNWIFAPVWTLLYLLMGFSAYLLWKQGTQDKKIRIALSFFLIQLTLNFLWTFIFFGLRMPLAAFVEIVFLWIAIFITIVKFSFFSKPAAYLLLPYLTWVTFVSLLNLSIVFLN